MIIIKSDLEKFKEISLKDDLVDGWLDHVKSKTPYKREKIDGKACYFEKAEVHGRDIALAEHPEYKCEFIKDLRIRNGDHFFMNIVYSSRKKKIIKYHPSGDHILAFKDQNARMFYVPFLLDYTKRWNSRIEHFRGTMMDEVPLLFASFNFLCSDTVLSATIFLLAYVLLGQVIGVLYFQAIASQIYQTMGVFIGVCMVSLDCMIGSTSSY